MMWGVNVPSTLSAAHLICVIGADNQSVDMCKHVSLAGDCMAGEMVFVLVGQNDMYPLR